MQTDGTVSYYIKVLVESMVREMKGNSQALACLWHGIKFCLLLTDWKHILSFFVLQDVGLQYEYALFLHIAQITVQ